MYKLNSDGTTIDRCPHGEAIQFFGEYREANAKDFVAIMGGRVYERTAITFSIEYKRRLGNGLWHVRVVMHGANGNANFYGSDEAQVTREAEAFIKGKLELAPPTTEQVKGLQRKVAEQAKEIRRLKSMVGITRDLNTELQKAKGALYSEAGRHKDTQRKLDKANNLLDAHRKEAEHRIANDAQRLASQIKSPFASQPPIQTSPIFTPLAGVGVPPPSIWTRFDDLEARIAKLEAEKREPQWHSNSAVIERLEKLEAAAKPAKTGPVKISGIIADNMGIVGLRRLANLHARPVHVVGESQYHQGRIVEPNN